MRRARIVCFAAIPALPAMAVAFWLGAAPTTSYRIIASRSRIEVTVKTEGQIHQGHGLVLLAHDVKGRIVFDPLKPSAARVEFRCPVRGLEPYSPRMTIDEANYIMNFIRSTWVFDVGKNPEIAFIGSGIKFGEARGSGFYGVHCPGQLEMHGRRNPVVLDGIARVTSEGIEVSGRHYVRQRDFSMIPLKDVSGVYTIKNEVEVSYKIWAAPEVENELHEDEAQMPKLTERAEKSGELKDKGQPPEMKRPEPEVKNPKSGEFTAPKFEPK